jgi:hypothetical protein
MSKLADPTICPDCRGDLDSAGTCGSCGLRLSGPLAGELWQTMLRADSLLERLRLAPAPAAAPADAPAPFPAAPSVRLPVRSRRLPAASVPVVLLGLGGLCLLVSAVVFVAVTWSSLGIGARTGILLLVTALLAAAAAAVTTRGLRGAGETLWTVVPGMLALDLLGARAAGMLGLDALPDRHAAGLLGLVLVTAGAGAGLWSAGRPTGRLHAPQAVAVLGLLLTTVAEGYAATRPSMATAVAVAALAGLAVLLRRALPWASYGAGALALLSWLGLALDGVHRLAESSGDAAWWSGLQGWPLLVAAGYATVVALLPVDEPRVHWSSWRPAAAGAALVCASVLVVGPMDSPTGDLLVGSAVVVALGALALVRTVVWSRPAAVLAGTGCAALALHLVARPWPTLGALPSDGGLSLTAELPADTVAAAPWTALAVAAALLTAAWGAAAALPSSARGRVRDRLLPAIAPGTVGLAAGSLVVAAGAPVWVAALALAVALAAALVTVVWQQGESGVELAAVAAVAVVAAPALRLALCSQVLTAALCSAGAVVLLAGHRWLRPALLWGTGATVLAALGVLSGAAAVVAWSRFGDAPASVLALALAGYAVLTGLGARFCARDADGRVTIELTAFLVGLAAVALSPTTGVAATAATVVGSAVCLLAAVDPGRHRLGWLGAAVLGGATLLRVLAHVSAPELATLPAATLLLAAGAWRLRRDAAVTSVAALGSGVALALLPSLLLALDEPVSLRGVLVGLAGLAALGIGIGRRWSAPFLAGAATTGALAVRHLGPVAEALPRWVSFGALGLALLLVGITWEARRRDLGTAARYLAALR